MHKPPTHHGHPTLAASDDPVLAELLKHTQSLGNIDHKLPDAGATLGLSASGPEVEALHAALLKIGQHVPEAERSERVLGAGTADALRRVQAANGIASTGALDISTRAAIGRALAEADLEKSRIEGRVLLT